MTLTTLVALTLAPEASAQGTLPACPADDGIDKLTTFAPDFGRHGQSGRYDVELAEGAGVGDISDVTITFAPQHGPPSTGPVFLDSDGNATLVLPAPTEGTSYAVQYDWTQDAGTQAACRGSDHYTIPLIPVAATAGKVDQPRLEGRFHVSYKPLNDRRPSAPATWTVSAGCDYFACSGRLHSTGGLDGKLELLDGARYRLVQHIADAGDCKVVRVDSDPFTGEVLSRTETTVRHAFRATNTFTLKVSTSASGPSTGFSGTETYVVSPTAAARARHCTKTSTYRDRVTGRAL